MNLSGFSFLNPDWRLGAVLFIWILILVLKNRKAPVLNFLRFLTVSILVIALMDPVFQSLSRKKTRFFLILDQSASILKKDRDQMLVEAKKLQNFLEKSQKELTILPVSSDCHPISINALQTLPVSFTSPIALCMEEALKHLQPQESPVLFLVSDGNDNTKNAHRLDDFVGIPLFFLPLKPGFEDSLKILSVHIPSFVMKNEYFQVEGIFESFKKQTVEIEFLENEKRISSQKMAVSSGVFSFSFVKKADQEGVFLQKIRLIGEPEEKLKSNNVFTITQKVGKNPHVLIVAKSENPLLQKLFSELGLEVKTSLPENSPNHFENILAVVLDDVPASSLSSEFLPKLEKYVRNGGNLLVTGGRSSYGLGGFSGTVLEEILPVYTPPRSYKKSMAILFLMDSSGSMITEDQKHSAQAMILNDFFNTTPLQQRPIHVAKESAKSIIRNLKGVDVGVIHFNSQAYMTVPLQTVEEGNLSEILSSVDSIQAGGGTRFYPAIQGGLSLLEKGKYSRVEFVLLSDGSPSDGGLALQSLSELPDFQAKLSTIAFGKGANLGILEEMARRGGGNFFHSKDIHSLQSAFEKVVDQVFGPPVIEDKISVYPKDPQWKNEFTSLSHLDGISTLIAKKRSVVLLEDENKNPVLSWWGFGAGRVLCFASDAKGLWSFNWNQSGEFFRVLGKAVSEVFEFREGEVRLQSSFRQGRLSVSLSALGRQGEWQEDLMPICHWKANDKAGSFSLYYYGEGEYRGEEVCGDVQKVNLECSLSDEIPPISREVAQDFEEELSKDRENHEWIFRLRNRGSVILSSWEEFYSRYDNLTRKKQEIELRSQSSFSSVFVFLAFISFFFELFYRRFFRHQVKQGELDFDKMARFYLQNAKKQVRQSEKEAEKSFMAAHRYAKKAKNEKLAAEIWEEMRGRI